VRRLFLALLLMLGLAAPALAKPPLVLAAASLQESLNAAADAWAGKGHERPLLSFAASSALARQIEAGAPADLFVSADEEWMDAVAAKGLVRKGTWWSFLGNRLVLIAPLASRLSIRVGPNMKLAAVLGDGKLAMGDPDSVPAGKYGRAALTRLGVWDSVATRVVRAENVRAALAFVERGEAAAGIVYATDAKASRKVRVVGVFPSNSHPAIRYPVAILTSSTSADAEPFRRFLVSREGRAIFARFGFTKP